MHDIFHNVETVEYTKRKQKDHKALLIFPHRKVLDIHIIDYDFVTVVFIVSHDLVCAMKRFGSKARDDLFVRRRKQKKRKLEENGVNDHSIRNGQPSTRGRCKDPAHTLLRDPSNRDGEENNKAIRTKM